MYSRVDFHSCKYNDQFILQPILTKCQVSPFFIYENYVCAVGKWKLGSGFVKADSQSINLQSNDVHIAVLMNREHIREYIEFIKKLFSLSILKRII